MIMSCSSQNKIQSRLVISESDFSQAKDGGILSKRSFCFQITVLRLVSASLEVSSASSHLSLSTCQALLCIIDGSSHQGSYASFFLRSHKIYSSFF